MPCQQGNHPPSKAVEFNSKFHEFCQDDNEEKVIKNLQEPLSIIVKVTRRCNLHCQFCSESEFFDDPPFESLLEVRDAIQGVRRVYLSGGEPLLRDDLIDLLDSYRPYFDIIGLPTNAIGITEALCNQLVSRVNYINAGLDGPRAVNDQIRGGFDAIINGLMKLRGSGISVALSTVLMKETLPHLQFVIQIADILGIPKVKLVLPVPRGRAAQLKPGEYPSNDEIQEKFRELKYLKQTLGWFPKLKLVLWGPDLEGYALLVYPNKEVYAWPVFDQPECALKVGNLATETIQEIWQAYPFKENHVRKYIGASIIQA